MKPEAMNEALELLHADLYDLCEGAKYAHNHEYKVYLSAQITALEAAMTALEGTIS